MTSARLAAGSPLPLQCPNLCLSGLLTWSRTRPPTSTFKRHSSQLRMRCYGLPAGAAGRPAQRGELPPAAPGRRRIRGESRAQGHPGGWAQAKPSQTPSGAGAPACHPLEDTRLHQSHQPAQSTSFLEPQDCSWPSMTVAPSLSASQPGSGRACPPASPSTWMMHCPGPGRQPPWLGPQPAGRWDAGEPDAGVSVLLAGSQQRALVFQKRFPK